MKLLGLEPLPHQKEGAEFLARQGHALLADQPGLGKTLQALLAAKLVKARTGLVICPASVREMWKRLVEKAGFPVRSWIVVSYNEAVKFAESGTLSSIHKPFDVLILDEAHYLKTPQSRRTKAVFGNRHGLARRCKYKWCLTGTPVLNRPSELFPVLSTLHPAFARTSFAHFAYRYCNAFWDGRAINAKGASNLEELSKLLAPFMLRRTKREVFPDRSSPLVSRVPLELTAGEMREVHEAEAEIGERESHISQAAEKFSQLGDTSRLLRLLGEAKLGQAANFVEDKLETVEKVAVFAHHSTVISGLFQVFSRRGFDPVVYKGGMSDRQKKAAVDAFVGERNRRVFIGQRQASGVGVDGLQSVCSTVVIAEPSWVPGETEQMIDRFDRMGQEEDIVNVYVLYATGTLDEAVVQVHDRKEKIIERVVVVDPVRAKTPLPSWVDLLQ